MKDNFKRSLRFAIPLFLGLGSSIILFFLIFRFDIVSKGFSTLMSILAPFIYGGVIAYLLKTPYNLVENWLTKLFKGKKTGLVKALSLIIILLAVVLIIYLLFAMIIPALSNSFISISQAIPGIITEMDKTFTGIRSSNPEVGNYIDTAMNTVKTKGPDWIRDTILPRLNDTFGGIVGVFGSIFGFIYNLLVAPIICIYILLEKEKFARQGKMMVYSMFHRDFAEKILDEFAYIDKTFVGFFGGKVLDCAIVGLICYVFCLILQLTMGMHNAVLIAVIIGVTNFIPFFGPYIGIIPSAIIILMDSPICCLFFVIFVSLLLLFDGNVLGPKLLSESVGLTGFWVLFSITLFGGLFGVAGILIGVPVFAVIYDLIRRWVHRMLKKHQITEYLTDEIKEDKG